MLSASLNKSLPSFPSIPLARSGPLSYELAIRVIATGLYEYVREPEEDILNLSYEYFIIITSVVCHALFYFAVLFSCQFDVYVIFQDRIRPNKTFIFIFVM